MYPLNDNDLDRVSREAADQFDVDQNTSGWEALENRLNRELPLKEDKERRRFLFWLFFIVLLAGGGLLWTMTGKRSDTNLAVTGTNTVPSAHNTPNNNVPVTPAAVPGVPAEQTAPTTTPVTTTEAQHPATPGSTQKVTTAPALPPSSATSAPASGQPGVTAPAAPVASSTKKSSPSISPVGRDKVAVDKFLSDKADRKNIAASKKGKRSSRPTDKEKMPSGEIDDYMVPIGYVNDLDNANAHPLKASIVSGVDWESNIGPIKAPTLAILVTESADGKNTPPKKTNNKNKGFEIGLVAGPDMSNVKFTDMDKAGFNAGLQIGYRFSDRWSVNTGLLYTKKNYTAQGKDFTKSNNGWWQNKELHTAQGYCAMFDIPLNIRYDFSVNKKQRWFASAGASSYIMTKEDYTYNYTYTGSSALRQSYWESDSTSKYLFSILNFSAGFERALNKRFSLQAEPYFKIPVKGLGYGKLDLTSYGIYFSLKYRFYK